MIPISGNVNAMPRKVSCKLVIGGNTITDVKLLTYNSDWSGDITIGQVVSSYITATIPTPGFSLTGANVAHSMGIGDPAEWVAIGQYRVDENSVRNRQGYTSFSAYDKLHDAVSTYTANTAYAETLQGLCNDVCNQIGIGTMGNLGSIGATAVEKASLNGYTLRDVLGFVAALCGKNAYLDANNDLVLKWFSSTSYTADNTRANVPYVGENDCTVGRLICQGADGTYTYGSGEGIYFTCPLINADNQQSLLSYIYSCVSGLTYRKADVDIPYGNFCLQSGDIITVSTTGSNLTVPIMVNSWTYDGGLSSAVSAYGVSDYSGTANNAEHSVSSRRVQEIMETKRTITGLQADIAYASALITGATGGVMRINMGGNGKPAELLILDTGNIATAQKVFRLNENGLGYSNTGYSGTYETAITYDGLIVADRIAGNKITGVKLESISEGTGSQPEVIVENGTYTINKVDTSTGTVTTVGKIKYLAPQAADEVDSIDVQVVQGNSFRIGTLTGPAMIYYSDTSLAPSGAEPFQFYGNVKVYGDIIYGAIGTSLISKLEDLEQRIEVLENALDNSQ